VEFHFGGPATLSVWVDLEVKGGCLYAAGVEAGIHSSAGVLSCYGASGTEVWSVTDNSFIFAYGLEVSDRLYLYGLSSASNGQDPLVSCYSMEGDLLWTTSWSVPRIVKDVMAECGDGGLGLRHRQLVPVESGTRRTFSSPRSAPTGHTCGP